MSAPADGNTTIVVIQLEPGLVYVKVADPKPGSLRLEPLLRQTIDHWFGTRPQFVIDRSEAVVENDGLRGINVWYHDARPGGPPTKPAVGQELPREYLEAVLDEAMTISLDFKDRQNTLLMVNPRGVAVIVDQVARRHVVMPVAFVDRIIQGPTMAKLQAWLAAPKNRFYVIDIPGSWFAAS